MSKHHEYKVEYIPWMGAYRIFEHGYVGWTVAYADSLEEAKRRAIDEGASLEYIDNDNYHHILVK